MPHKHDFEIKSNVYLFSKLYAKMMSLETWVLDLGSLNSKARCVTKFLGEVDQVL